jgi:hypothetical protein
MVVATLKPGPCSLEGIPNQSVVCLSIEGDGTPGQCGRNLGGTDPAWVYRPYRPGATYVVTGRGCADVFDDPIHHNTGPMKTVCQTVGPTSFTL